MKHITVLLCYIFAFTYCNATIIDSSYDYPNPNSSEETTELNITLNSNCTEMRFRCESCNKLVMCIDTEFGFTKQYVTCPLGSTCLRDKCTQEQNPLCDGTADIPFKCHVPGVFPDPFDCKKYHFCVPTTKMVNGTIKLKNFPHSCQENNGVQYRYDPKSRYCKFEIENDCEDWPVPLCTHKAQTGALEENKSIFFVCEMVNGLLYPHLYACPHGEEYNYITTKCETQIYYHHFPHSFETTTPAYQEYTPGAYPVPANW